MFSTFAWLVMAILLVLSPLSLAETEGERNAIRTELESLQQFGRLSIGNVDIASGALLAEIYGRRNYVPAWTDKDQIAELVVAIKATIEDGLDPLDYHLDSVLSAQSTLNAGQLDTTAEVADADLILTDSLIRLGYHQRFGKVNPYSLDPNWNFSRSLNGIDAATAIQEAIDADSLIEYLHAVFPRDWVYTQLRDALARYRQIAMTGGWPQIPDGPTLRPGDVDPRLTALVQRLAITGDIERMQTLAPVTDYNEVIQGGVRHFQERHSLDTDGVIGPATLESLNVSAAQRVLQLEINLERARWVLSDVSDDFILVNIAGFRAYLVRDRKIVWRTKVQVGKTYHQSPVFSDEMRYLDFNPTWTVPYSIASKELLPKIKSDPGFFQKRDFDLKDRGGKLIDPATVDWSTVSRRNFGYTLVQRPGPQNALGRIKFMFPNKHSVYLHDTPSKYLFGQAERAFSHGCIRVENPFELAELLLGPDWDQDRITTVLDSRVTKSVLLPKPLPVLLMYWTAIVSEDGEVFFYNDVYDRDQNVADALNEPFRIELTEG